MSDVVRTASDVMVSITDRSMKFGSILFTVGRVFLARTSSEPMSGFSVRRPGLVWSVDEVVVGWQGRVTWPN
jgi:hypothetical protein